MLPPGRARAADPAAILRFQHPGGRQAPSPTCGSLRTQRVCRAPHGRTPRTDAGRACRGALRRQRCILHRVPGLLACSRLSIILPALGVCLSFASVCVCANLPVCLPVCLSSSGTLAVWASAVAEAPLRCMRLSAHAALIRARWSG